MHRQTCHIDRLLSTAVAGSMCTPGLTVTDKGIILTRIQWMSLSLYVFQEMFTYILININCENRMSRAAKLHSCKVGCLLH